jgi:hypothetical protein
MQVGGTVFGGGDDILVSIRNGTNSFGHTTAGVLSTATWGHWMFVFDGSQSTNATRLSIYFNGTQQTLAFNGTIPASLPATTAILTLGNNVVADSTIFSGTLAEVAVWAGTVLTPAHISQLARGCSPEYINPHPSLYSTLIRDVIDASGLATPTVTGTTVAEHTRIYYAAGLISGPRNTVTRSGGRLLRGFF